MNKLPALSLFMLISGCSPFLEYEHLSDPRIKNDGYDLVCVGTATTYVSVSACQNMAAYGGQFLKINARYQFDD